MADILTLNPEEKDIRKIVAAIRQLAERFQPSEDLAAGALLAANNLSDVANAATAFGNIKQAATDAATGVVELATTTEVLTGTDTSRAVTPDALAALWEKGSDITSGATISIGEGEYFHVTGTTTITDIDFATAKDGRKAILVFDGALTLTHNSTTLILPTGANITTAADDTCCVVQESSDNVRVVWYMRKDGTALTGAAAPAILQVLQTTYATNTDLNTDLPIDDTVPTSTEGDQVLSLAITPTDNTNKILATVHLFGGTSGAAPQMAAALFRGTTCINAWVWDSTAAGSAAGGGGVMYLDSPATTSATTYSVRVGSNTGGAAVRLNGHNTSRLFGGAAASTLTLMEVSAS